jgi:hypothetical protein
MSDDRISNASAGRYFPETAAEIVLRVATLAFSVHSYDKRLPIIMENADFECERGLQLCSFLRMSYLAVFSLPESVPPAIAKRAIEYTLARFSEIDKGPRLSVRAQQFVVHRAFLAPVGKISITQHIVSAGSRSYLQFRKASRLSKAESESKRQQEIYSVQVA